jgi:OmpA-OmpF porin, OOP family
MTRLAGTTVIVTLSFAVGCAGAPGERTGDRSGAPSSAAAVPAATAAGAAPRPVAAARERIRIPLIAGLTVVTAVTMSGAGDGESVKQVKAVTADDVSLTYSADLPERGLAGLFGGSSAKPRVRQVRGVRTVSRTDLEDGREYMHLFGSALPERVPGSTALGVSAAVLRDLKTTGQANLTMRASGLGAGLANLIGGFAGPEFAGLEEISELEDIDRIRGTVERVHARPVPFELLVNGRRTTLHGIHARGRLGDQLAEFLFLDDEANPLALQWEVGEDRLQVIAIAFPDTDDPGEGNIAADLAATGRTEVYGIYFDFGSDVVRPQSESVLQQIAEVMRRHADWSIRVEGHTDNVGTDAYNQDLSGRRAAAVVHALTTGHGIPAARLSAVGFGASRPKDTNETVEGRAMNRRVELVKP